MRLVLLGFGLFLLIGMFGSETRPPEVLSPDGGGYADTNDR